MEEVPTGKYGNNIPLEQCLLIMSEPTMTDQLINPAARIPPDLNVNAAPTGHIGTVLIEDFGTIPSTENRENELAEQSRRCHGRLSPSFLFAPKNKRTRPNGGEQLQQNSSRRRPLHYGTTAPTATA